MLRVFGVNDSCSDGGCPIKGSCISDHSCDNHCGGDCPGQCVNNCIAVCDTLTCTTQKCMINSKE